ncbi:hypothetical protein [Pseudoxanthomonas dokdonensis]|nr:hypothetical protein [Pseudoxanthomonas dokdonensis]
MRRCFLMIVLLSSMGAAYAQKAPAANQASPSLYSLNSAGLASAMTWCIARHGQMTNGSPAEACFKKTRQVLADAGLKQRADQVDAKCRATTNFNTCLTPEIGRLVFDLNAEFAKQKP